MTTSMTIPIAQLLGLSLAATGKAIMDSAGSAPNFEQAKVANDAVQLWDDTVELIQKWLLSEADMPTAIVFNTTIAQELQNYVDS